jgi:hypothetical protein
MKGGEPVLKRGEPVLTIPRPASLYNPPQLRGATPPPKVDGPLVATRRRDRCPTVKNTCKQRIRYVGQGGLETGEGKELR